VFAKAYAQYYELLNHKKDYKKEIEFVWNWARQPMRILDLGAGTAHYWQYYPEGVVVRGIERSYEMIEMSPYRNCIACQEIQKVDGFDGPFDLVTALFDVMAYLKDHTWWKNLPLESGGYFIFDMWDKEKVLKDGFKMTILVVKDVVRLITPIYHDEHKVRLQIDLTSSTVCMSEVHEMFLYDLEDIVELAGKEYELTGVQKTENWQTWIKLKRR